MSIVKARKEFNPIDEIDITDDMLSSRAGLAPLSEFVRKCGVPDTLARLCPIKKTAKGISDASLYHQILVNFMDGTSRSLIHFDHLRADPSYLQSIGLGMQQGASSHSVKRFIGTMTQGDSRRFRRVLLEQFRHLLRQEKPEQVILDIDTVVYDNDTALAREGCSPTYKKVKGFQPLMVKYNNIVVWSEFREGKVHSNHGTAVVHALKVLAALIRDVRGDIPIIVTLDSGFFDQKNFTYMEKQNLYYVCSGKQYKDLLEHIRVLPAEAFRVFQSPNPDGVWEYVDLIDRRGSWDIARRAIYTRRTRTREGQYELLGLEAVYYTNLDMPACDILALAHGRGTAELVHRKLKDFAGELLPFKAFVHNEAWFFLMLIAFNLFELFKIGVDPLLHTASMYPTSFRRAFIDIAGKIVRHAHRIVLKATVNSYEAIKVLWEFQRDFVYP
jgi:hypothetical protein